jgi:hypothetical protein
VGWIPIACGGLKPLFVIMTQPLYSQEPTNQNTGILN